MTYDAVDAHTHTHTRICHVSAYQGIGRTPERVELDRVHRIGRVSSPMTFEGVVRCLTRVAHV
jgi:hypothetical protein